MWIETSECQLLNSDDFVKIFLADGIVAEPRTKESERRRLEHILKTTDFDCMHSVWMMLGKALAEGKAFFSVPDALAVYCRDNEPHEMRRIAIRNAPLV
jgi:hypothetical protein